MSVPVTSSGQVRMTLLGASRWSTIAVGLISARLGLDRRAVARRLARQPSVLAEDVPLDLALPLLPTLAALGIVVRLEAPGTPLPDPVVEMAIQTSGEPSAATIARLAALLRRSSGAVLAELAAPAGLVLSLRQGEAEALRLQLRREARLRLVVSTPERARYDLFLRPGCSANPALATLLRRLGLAACPLSGAVGAAVDARTAALVVARHGAILHAMNRDFQRFDLFLDGSSGLTRPELVDFLATRTSVRRESLLAPGHAGTLRLEAGLTRTAAVQFRADYAELGLETRIALVMSPTPADT